MGVARGQNAEELMRLIRGGERREGLFRGPWGVLGAASAAAGQRSHGRSAVSQRSRFSARPRLAWAGLVEGRVTVG